MLQEKERAFLDGRFSTHLACWGSKCAVTTVQTLLLHKLFTDILICTITRTVGTLWIKEENKKDYSHKVIHLLLASKSSLASQKLWYWSSNADNTECNVILKMFKPNWSSLVKTMMVFSACQIKMYFMFLALNSVGYLPVTNGFRLLISSLQKWLSEIWPDFGMILRYIFAACSQTSHKLVFIWTLTTCAMLLAHPSHEDFYNLLPMQQCSLSWRKGV